MRRSLKFVGNPYVEPEGIVGGLALWCKSQDEEVASKCRVFLVYGPTDFEERQFYLEND